LTLYIAEVIRHYDAIPDNNRLKLEKTFAQQRNKVNKSIVPRLMDVLDTDVFPVVDNIVYDMVYNLHRHRREEFLKGIVRPLIGNWKGKGNIRTHAATM